MKTADLYIRARADSKELEKRISSYQENELRNYCSDNNITFRKVYRDSCSAGNFNRYSWNRYLANPQGHRHHADLLLFTTWDRFSRNVGDSFRMIGTLRNLGIKALAIHQPQEFYC